MYDGIKISSNPKILHSIIDDRGETLLAAWNPGVPKEVQACLDAFNVETLFHSKQDGDDPRSAGIIDWEWGKYPALTPYFNHVLRCKEYVEDVRQTSDLTPRIDIFEAGFQAIGNLFHRDKGRWEIQRRKEKDIREEITSNLILTSHGAKKRQGRMKFLDKLNAQYAVAAVSTHSWMTDIKNKANFYDVKREARIRFLPIGALGLFLLGSDDGLVHAGDPVQSGYRWWLTFN